MLGMLKMGGNVQHGASCSLSMLCVSGGFEPPACQPGSIGQNLPSCKSRNLLSMWLLGQENVTITREETAFRHTRVNDKWNQCSQSGWRGIRSNVIGHSGNCLKDAPGNAYRCRSATEHAPISGTWICLSADLAGSAFVNKHWCGIENNNCDLGRQAIENKWDQTNTRWMAISSERYHQTRHRKLVECWKKRSTPFANIWDWEKL